MMGGKEGIRWCRVHGKGNREKRMKSKVVDIFKESMFLKVVMLRVGRGGRLD